MARPVTALVVFFLAMNLFAGMLGATGTDAMLGIDSDVGAGQATDDLQQQTNNVESGTSTGSTLFGMYNVLAGQISGFFHYIFPGLDMLHRAGTPGWITAGFLAPLFSVAIFVDVVSFFRGWGL